MTHSSHHWYQTVRHNVGQGDTMSRRSLKVRKFEELIHWCSCQKAQGQITKRFRQFIQVIEWKTAGAIFRWLRKYRKMSHRQTYRSPTFSINPQQKVICQFNTCGRLIFSKENIQTILFLVINHTSISRRFIDFPTHRIILHKSGFFSGEIQPIMYENGEPHSPAAPKTAPYHRRGSATLFAPFHKSRCPLFAPDH